jgi:hypothetical protein
VGFLFERYKCRWNRFEANPPESITLEEVPFPSPEELQASLTRLGEKKAFQKLALRWVSHAESSCNGLNNVLWQHPDKFLQKFSANLQEEVEALSFLLPHPAIHITRTLVGYFGERYLE